jgi:hypothetical protein
VIDDAKSVLSLIPAELLHRIGPRLVRDNQTILASLDAALGRSQYGYTPRGGLHGAVLRPDAGFPRAIKCGNNKTSFRF